MLIVLTVSVSVALLYLLQRVCPTNCGDAGCDKNIFEQREPR